MALVYKTYWTSCTSFSIDVDRYSQNGKMSFLSHPLGNFVDILIGALSYVVITDCLTFSLAFMPVTTELTSQLAFFLKRESNFRATYYVEGL